MRLASNSIYLLEYRGEVVTVVNMSSLSCSQTKKDVRKMLPTVILFFIPFFGYVVPAIA